MKKAVKVFGAPLLDENFNPVKVTIKQARALAKRKAADFEKKGKCYFGAKGSVFESETHFCVNVGWKVEGLK